MGDAHSQHFKWPVQNPDRWTGDHQIVLKAYLWATDAKWDISRVCHHPHSQGLYRYKRLPYRISSAPAIFQKLMKILLGGIPGSYVLKRRSGNRNGWCHSPEKTAWSINSHEGSWPLHSEKEVLLHAEPSGLPATHSQRLRYKHYRMHQFPKMWPTSYHSLGWWTTMAILCPSYLQYWSPWHFCCMTTYHSIGRQAAMRGLTTSKVSGAKSQCWLTMILSYLWSWLMMLHL